jgi:hypothetical protein
MAEAARPAGRQDQLLLAGLLAVLAVPLLVGLAALRRPTWYPVLDLAMTELRLRDVGTAHTPLVGLPGRIGTLAEQGSHPGPLSFYLLAPVYRLLGSTAWAMQVAAVVLNLGALGLSLWIALRRGGRRMLVAVGALLALLTAGYGISPLSEPWNPYLPMLWWVVVLLAAWSVLAGDIALYPVLVLAASYGAQTHLPYLGLGGGVVGVVTLVLVLRVVRAGEDRRRLLRWTAAGLGLGLVLWLPPVLDVISPPAGDRSNAGLIADSMLTPEEDPVGLGRGVEVMLRHLDVRNLVVPGDGGDDGGDGSLIDSAYDQGGSVVVGVIVLAAWLAAAAWTARARRAQRELWFLHQVVGLALVLGVVSVSRIFGKVWYYLGLWGWGTAVVLLLSVGCTAAAAIGPRLDDRWRRLAVRAGGVAAAIVVAVSSLAFAADASGAPTPDANLSSTLAAVLPDLVAAVERGDGAAVGLDGRYLVAWSDAFYFGSQGYGLVSELERRGIDAEVGRPWRVPVTRHRVVDPIGDADATIGLATGIYVDQWREVPGAVEIVHVEPRGPEQLAEYARLREEVLDGLEAEGLDDLVPLVDSNLFGASIDERISRGLEERMARMLLLGQETAVFIAPAGVQL